MSLNAHSQAALSAAHPLLQKLIHAVVEAHPQLSFQILEARRGRLAQEQAFAKGNSRAHFGQSPHNYTPAIALDIVPLPLDWKDVPSFVALSKPILATAKTLGIPISWGGTWKSLKDYPHYEIDPWREFAKEARPYAG